MKTVIALFVIASLLVTLVTLDMYFIAVQDTELKESHWVQDCKPPVPYQVVPSIGLYNNTHGFDLMTCTWYPSDNGTPGLIKSLYISFVEPHILDLLNGFTFQYAYACTCIDNMPIEQKVIKNDIIFSGKLVEKYENLNYKGFIFEIDKLWKNHSGKILLEQKNITIFSNLDESNCGTDFTVGLNYLVYSEMQGKLAHTYLCSGSGLLFVKSSDLKHFEENDIQGKAYYEKEHPLIPGSTAKMERDCRDGLLEKEGSVISNSTHYYSKDTCQWLDLENEKSNKDNEPYKDENLRLAEKTFQAEENMGGGSGMPLFDKDTLFYPYVILVGVIGGLGILFLVKKRK